MFHLKRERVGCPDSDTFLPGLDSCSKHSQLNKCQRAQMNWLWALAGTRSKSCLLRSLANQRSPLVIVRKNSRENIMSLSSEFYPSPSDNKESLRPGVQRPRSKNEEILINSHSPFSGH